MIHSILFTGHLIDAAGRKEPRFPPEKELLVRAAVEQQLLQLTKNTSEKLIGITGAACGSDILFLELCESFEIHTEIYLALPKEEFKRQSVSYAGKQWDERFERLIQKTPVHIVSKHEDENESVWEKANLAMLNRALKNGPQHMTMIAVWNGSIGDGKGGTEHMVKVSKAAGASVKIIDITKLR